MVPLRVWARSRLCAQPSRGVVALGAAYGSRGNEEEKGMKPPGFGRGSTAKCPICRKPFRSDLCPHSILEAEIRWQENRIREIVREEIRKREKT